MVVIAGVSAIIFIVSSMNVTKQIYKAFSSKSYDEAKISVPANRKHDDMEGNLPQKPSQEPFKKPNSDDMSINNLYAEVKSLKKEVFDIRETSQETIKNLKEVELKVTEKKKT
ncbi:hypothetical protein [Liberibacter crescens]|nr:hypothetical protein [Liberibacter crescens]